MAYRNGGQLISGEIEYDKKGVNSQSLTARHRWEQTEQWAMFLHLTGLLSPWENQHILYQFPCLNEPDVIINMRVGETLREIDFEKKQTTIFVRWKLLPVKTEQAANG